MEEARYFENPTAVTESAIQSCIAQHPDFCDAWIGYSQDRRTDSGWVIDEQNDVFTLFYYPNGSTKLKFDDRSAASATFAIRELASLAWRRAVSGDIGAGISFGSWSTSGGGRGVPAFCQR